MSMSSLFELFTISLPARGVSKPLKEAVRSRDASKLDVVFKTELSRLAKTFCKFSAGDMFCAMWSVDSVSLSGRERELAASIEEAFDRNPVVGVKKRSSRDKKSKRRAKPPMPVGKVISELLCNWLVEAACPLGHWEQLTICEILIRHGANLNSDTRLRCLALLLEQHEIQPQEELAAGIWGDDPQSSQPLRYKYVQPLIVIEAQLLLSLVIRPFIDDDVERKEAVSILTQTLIDCTDDNGLAQGPIVAVLPHLLALWTRLMVWGTVCDQPMGSKKICERFKLLIEKCSMLLLPNHELATPSETSATAAQSVFGRIDAAEILSTGSFIAGFRARGKVRRLVSDIMTTESAERVRRQLIRQMKSGRKEEAGFKGTQAWQSDSSNMCIMRSSADKMADVCNVEWSGPTVNLLLAAFGIPALDGAWNTHITIDGHLHAMDSTWECTCWYSDDEIAFAELESRCDDVTHVRHIALATQERFAILTDSIRYSGTKAKETTLDVTSSLSLTSACNAHRDDVTRELQIDTGDVSLRAFPLWLADDRIDHAEGEFSVDGAQLKMTTKSTGGATLPVVLDWHPRRTAQPADWTRLTVAEARRNISVAEAVGYRLRIGKHQLLAYLSLIPPKLNRTVLGVHTPDESFYGRVEASGDLNPFVQVEARPEESGV